MMYLLQSDQQVENTMDGERDGIVVRSKYLPDGLDELLLLVFAEFGRPVLYAKTERASGLRVIVASREHGERTFKSKFVFTVYNIVP